MASLRRPPPADRTPDPEPHNPEPPRPMELTSARLHTAHQIEADWETNPRWEGVERPYSAEDVLTLRGSIQIEHTLARLGAERLWSLIHDRDYVNALGAMTGGQAVQQVKAGLEAVYLSGWQVAADANLAGDVYPDQSLYPANSVPTVVERINNALLRADQVAWSERSVGGAAGGGGRDALPRAHRGRRRGWVRRGAQRARAHEGARRRRRGGASTSRTSSRRRRSAGTWAARSSCPPASS